MLNSVVGLPIESKVGGTFHHRLREDWRDVAYIERQGSMARTGFWSG